jgi:hypothetical protein
MIMAKKDKVNPKHHNQWSGPPTDGNVDDTQEKPENQNEWVSTNKANNSSTPKGSTNR